MIINLNVKGVLCFPNVLHMTEFTFNYQVAVAVWLLWALLMQCLSGYAHLNACTMNCACAQYKRVRSRFAITSYVSPGHPLTSEDWVESSSTLHCSPSVLPIPWVPRTKGAPGILTVIYTTLQSLCPFHLLIPQHKQCHLYMYVYPPVWSSCFGEMNSCSWSVGAKGLLYSFPHAMVYSAKDVNINEWTTHQC